MAESIFDLPEFRPYRGLWHERQGELERREGYYDGSHYAKLRESLGWLAPRIMRDVRPLYLPFARAVDVDAGIVPGGWAWPDPDTTEGVTQAMVDTWRVARRQVFDWSNWVTRGVLYVHYGAVFGVSALKIVDLRNRKQVQLEPVSPRNYLLMESEQYDSQPSLSIWIELRKDEDGRPVEYAEVIDADRIRTFWGGKPTGIDGREPEYPNELGFVPFVEVRHIETGKMLGECTYYKAIPLLDEVNQQASHLAKIISKHAEPQWAISGAEKTDLEHSGDIVWFLPSGATATPLVPAVDIEGILAFLKTIADNVNGALPELAFDELRTKTQIATATLELQLMDLTLKIKRVRPNYDQGLIEALRLVGRAAAGMGLPAIATLDDPALALDDARPVLPVDPMDAIRLEEAQLQLDTMRSLASGDGLTAAVNGGSAA